MTHASMITLLATAVAAPMTMGAVLDPAASKHWVEEFNRVDEEFPVGGIANAAAWEFLAANAPLFSCPDRDLERTYWFRWWTLRKHLVQTPDGFVITEFLPKVGWAGKHNTISCAAGHHFREARWLQDERILDDYATHWLRKGGALRSYSFWIADAVWQRACVTGSFTQAIDLLPDLVANSLEWEKTHRDPNGLYWQKDDRDGMEMSISGRLHPQALGYRATINSYQYADAMAIAAIAARAGQDSLAREYRERATTLKRLVQERLWDPQAQFFKVIPRTEGATWSDVRELHGYTPWYVNLPDPEFTVAWKQLMDPEGFFAPFGPTTAERRHPRFALSYEGHECQWNGPSWPFATSITLTGLANLLNGPDQAVVTKADYFKTLQIYANSHRLTRDDGTVVPWIDEDLNPLTGDWISRTRLKSWKDGTWYAGKGGKERGKDYNHSTFCDLIITGLCGLRPRADAVVEVNPLLPADTWDWFCLDRVRYHGHLLTIVYDKTGGHFGLGKGLRVLSDGKEIAVLDHVGHLEGKLP